MDEAEICTLVNRQWRFLIATKNPIADMTSALSYTFPILKSPTYPRLSAFVNTILSSCLGIGLLILFFGIPETIEIFSKAESLPIAYAVILATGSLLSLISAVAIIYRKRYPAELRIKQIGIILFHGEGVATQLGYTKRVWKWEQIERLDVYFSYGLHIKRLNHGNDARDEEKVFTNTEVLHLRLKAPEGYFSYHVLNKKEDGKARGELYSLLKQVRSEQLDFHRKIQFWAKIKTR